MLDTTINSALRVLRRTGEGTGSASGRRLETETVIAEILPQLRDPPLAEYAVAIPPYALPDGSHVQEGNGRPIGCP